MTFDECLALLTERQDCALDSPTGFPDADPWRLPDDLAIFYGRYGGAILFEDGFGLVSLSTPGEFVPIDRIMWEDGPLTWEGGPPGNSSESWFVLANDHAGNPVSIDLRPERCGWCYDTMIGHYGGPGDCMVIALSFTEFLFRSLGTNGENWYWLQDGFVPYGDAYDDLSK